MGPFGLKHPILQAPTGAIAGPDLAAAVTIAGGMGAMGLTWADPELAAKYVREVRSKTNGLFQVNFALAFAPKGLGPVLDAGVPVVTFSWGDPAPFVSEVKQSGALLGVQVTSRDGARRALDLGADFLIAQGIEAGGHVQSTTALLELLPLVVDEARQVPVAAAGGIATSQDVKQVLSLGAAAAVVGTAFVATVESAAHEDYKQMLVERNQTALTICFDVGWPFAAHRVLRNSTLEAWESAGSPAPGSRPGETDVVALGSEEIKRYEDTAPRAGMAGNIEAMCLYAGVGVARIRDIPTAAERIAQLVEGLTRH